MSRENEAQKNARLARERQQALIGLGCLTAILTVLTCGLTCGIHSKYFLVRLFCKGVVAVIVALLVGLIGYQLISFIIIMWRGY